jgi:hypothetical protein
MRGRIYYGGRTCPHIYLSYYFPVETGPDSFSRSLIRFKQGWLADSEFWTCCALEALEGLPLEMVIVRALHHDELILTGEEHTGLDELGRLIAGKFGGRYMPFLLGKRKVTMQFRDLHTSKQRREELKEVYYIREPVAAARVLLIDDIVTTGTTVAAILNEMAKAAPSAKFAVFSLAKAKFH